MHVLKSGLLWLGVMVVLTTGLCAQQKISWGMLETTALRPLADASDGAALRPRFPLDVLALDGRKVRISGYLIPLDLQGLEYALSAHPFASCYFCGGGSPASVLSLKLASGSRAYSMDEWVQFEGLFRLNPNPQAMMYSLEMAREVKP